MEWTALGGEVANVKVVPLYIIGDLREHRRSDRKNNKGTGGLNGIANSADCG